VVARFQRRFAAKVRPRGEKKQRPRACGYEELTEPFVIITRLPIPRACERAAAVDAEGGRDGDEPRHPPQRRGD